MLEELQSLSPAKKKQVLITVTIIIMVIVTGVWLAYFNSIIIGTAQEAATQATSSVAAAAPAPAGATTSTAAKANDFNMWQTIKRWFGSIGNTFSNPSQYKIQPQSN